MSEPQLSLGLVPEHFPYPLFGSSEARGVLWHPRNFALWFGIVTETGIYPIYLTGSTAPILCFLPKRVL
jgi:hypothetical protein